MAGLLRSFDWSKTPLGPIEQWPTPVKIIVEVILGSRFPMALWWGKDLVQIYNDAYRTAALCDKHPGALGRPAAEVWSEIWDVVGAQAAAVMSGGPATWQELMYVETLRDGVPTETYWTYSMSAVPDDARAVGGVLITGQETTDRVRSKRASRMLRHLAARAAEAKTAEEACANAMRIVQSNGADLPFALVYLLDDRGIKARLVACAGFGDLSRIPREIAVDGSEHQGWPLGEVTANVQVSPPRPAVIVEDLQARFGEMPRGTWRVPVTRAICLPLARVGQPTYGMIVIGLSPRRKLDERYEGLLRLVASQIVSGIANGRATEEQRRQAEQLAEIDRAKTQFFSRMSSELRTPLTLMLGPTEDALASRDRAMRGENLAMVYRGELRMLKLVNMLLDFSQVEAGRAWARFTKTDLGALTNELASSFRPAIERAGLVFRVSCEPVGEVPVDRDMWEKIVLHLLSNALKFTFEGEISMTLRRIDDRISLEVCDTGIGVSEAELPRLFERFYRVAHARARAQEGSGIGLALVQELVRLHRGTIRAASELGKGTRFTIEIPCSERRSELEAPQPHDPLAPAFIGEAERWLAPATTEAIVRSLEISEEIAGSRILVANDNSDMREYLARLLGERFRVETVHDGRAALAALRAQRFDLVVTDVLTPSLDAFGLLKEMRLDPAMRDTPVVLLSARAADLARAEGDGATADDYVMKPFSARELIARVTSQLKLAHARHERAVALEREQVARQEAELQKEHLFALLMQAPTPIAITHGPDHVVELANLAALKMWMRDPVDVLGKPMQEALPEMQHLGFREPLDQVYRTGCTYIGKNMRGRVDRGGGVIEQVYLNVVYAPRRQIEGGIEGVMILAFDVTDEVRARLDNVRLRTVAELAREEAELQKDHLFTLFRNAPLPIAIMRGTDHVFELANASVCEMWGRSPDSVLGRPARDVVPELFQQGLGKLLDDVLATCKPYVGKEVLVRVDGRGAAPSRELYVNFVFAPRVGIGGDVDGVMMIAWDVTEEVNLRKELDRLRDGAEAANRAKDEFLAMLGHELRNPLSPILTTLQVMRLRGINSPEQDMLERQVSHLTRLVDDLLDVSRITRGKVELRKQTLELSDVVERALEIVSPLLELRPHELVVDVPKKGLGVHVDSDRMVQVITNLLTNAAKYSDIGTRITVLGDRADHHVRLTVRDQGVGIEPAMLGRVFDLFVQQPQTIDRSRGGLGLGLSIVRSLVELHGGRVTVASEGAGKGSEFGVILPAAEMDALAPQKEPHRARIPHIAGQRILVVDDNEDAAHALGAALEELGCSVAVAFDGPTALATAEAFHPDIALVDIGLPVMDGYELARELRRQRHGTDHFHLVAVTGYGQDTDRQRSAEAGFERHLVKPVNLDNLERVVDELGSSRT